MLRKHREIPCLKSHNFSINDPANWPLHNGACVGVSDAFCWKRSSPTIFRSRIIYTFIIDSNSKANLLAWGFFFIPKSHAPPKVGLRRHVIFCANVCLQLVCFSKDGCHQSLWMTVSPPPPPTLSFTSWAKSVPKKMRRKNGVLCFRKVPQNRCTRCCYWASSFLLLILNFRDYVFVFACIVYVYSK